MWEDVPGGKPTEFRLRMCAPREYESSRPSLYYVTQDMHTGYFFRCQNTDQDSHADRLGFLPVVPKISA